MDNRRSLINNHYENYDEDNRLIKDNTHNVEYRVTTNYIEKYLKQNDKILEVGAGTGRYSLYYASQGYDVTAIEYTEHNLEILKSKITKDMRITAEQGDAVDLSRFPDNTFDMTLVLGPLYHLYNDDDIHKAITEAIRVTKKNGIIMFAYITSDGVFADWAVDHLLDGYLNDFDENFKLVRYPEGIFAPFYIQEFKNIMKEYDIEYMHNVAVDGIVNIISDKINALTEEEFKVWVKYQLSVCEREDLQGYSCHMLYICRKK
ncbi:MAG: class I SAM-dependent methyltransferase [Clostridia bacterium]